MTTNVPDFMRELSKDIAFVINRGIKVRKVTFRAGLDFSCFVDPAEHPNGWHLSLKDTGKVYGIPFEVGIQAEEFMITCEAKI